MTPTPSRSVGRYELLEVIGRGGAAVVYLALQRDLRRQVALKELAPLPGASDPSFAQRFSQESRVAGSLSHPNVVTVFEFLEHDGVPYIAMEYLPRGSLRQYVGSLTPAQIAGVLEGVLAGLAHGESRSVVHRDLKPENLLVTDDGRVKIADFGVARAYAYAATQPVVTAAGTMIGTPAYMAPEQALGREVGPAADLYSLGIVAWELLAGRAPFEDRDTPVAVLYQHVHEPVPPVRSVAPDVDPRIEAWLERMLAKDPAGRFPGAEAAWEALEDVVLELLGPRWRRDARLPVVDPGAAGRPLTPAVFDDGAPPPPAPPAPVEPPPPPPPPPPDPRHTVLRAARRHDPEPEEVAPRPPRRWIRRAAAIVAAVAVVAAVVVAVLLLSGGGRTAGAPRNATKSAPPDVVALQRILSSVALPLDEGVGQLAAAGSTSAQQSAGREVASAYATGVRLLSQQPPAVQNSHDGLATWGNLGVLEQDSNNLELNLRSENSVGVGIATAGLRRDAQKLDSELKGLDTQMGIPTSSA
jgi:serine/threonine protein kinase